MQLKRHDAARLRSQRSLRCCSSAVPTLFHADGRYKERVTNLFDGRTTYDSAYHIQLATSLLDKVDLRPGMRVLDIATGTGLVALPAAQAVAPTGQVAGLDLSAGMLEQARRKAMTAGIANVELLQQVRGNFSRELAAQADSCPSLPPHVTVAL